MEIFYSTDIAGNACRLDADESAHCIKVLRHRKGDIISVIDGKGSLMKCRLVSDSPKGAETEIIETVRNWGGHPYRLHLAVCPTKNNDRYEWFAEKACEIGVDTIIPIIGEHSERKVFKTSRIEKILISAAKQSLKGAVPEVADPMPVREFILKYGQEGADETYENAGKAQPAEKDGVSRMIAYCFEDGNRSRRGFLPGRSLARSQTRIHSYPPRTIPAAYRDGRGHCRRSRLFQVHVKPPFTRMDTGTF